MAKAMQNHIHFHGISGKVAMIPWEDDHVYCNRLTHRIKSSAKHELLLEQVRTLLWNYGGPLGKKSDATSIKKFYRIHMAIINEDPISINQKNIMIQSYKMEIPSTSKFSIQKCASQAKSPTIAVQFRQSLCRNPQNWKDKGHEDCLDELEEMIIPYLPHNVSAGLKKQILPPVVNT